VLPLPLSSDGRARSDSMALRLALQRHHGGLAIHAPEDELGAQGAAALSLIFNKSRLLREQCVALDLTSNTLTALGADFEPFRTLCKSLQRLTALATLSLRGNMLLRQGSSMLADLLRHAVSLRVLDASRSNIGPSGAEQLTLAFKADEDEDEEDGDVDSAVPRLPPPQPTPPCRNTWLRWLDLRCVVGAGS
jgi:hypothetical protein